MRTAHVCPIGHIRVNDVFLLWFWNSVRRPPPVPSMMGAILAEMVQGREHPSARAVARRLELGARAAVLGYLSVADPGPARRRRDGGPVDSLISWRRLTPDHGENLGGRLSVGGRVKSMLRVVSIIDRQRFIL